MGLEIASEKQSFLNNRLCSEVAARNQSQSLQLKLHTNIHLHVVFSQVLSKIALTQTPNQLPEFNMQFEDWCENVYPNPIPPSKEFVMMSLGNMTLSKPGVNQ